MSGATGPPRRPTATRGRRRGRALLPTVIIAGVLLLIFSIFTGIYTDFLWFKSVGYSSVFTKELSTKTLLFLVFGALFAAAVAVNFVVAWRTRPAYQALIPGQQELDRYRMAIDPYRRYVVLAIVALLGLIAGSSASSEWRTYMQWRNGVSFGVKDPQFGMDISFFTFDLPWYRFVLSFAFATVLLSLIAAAITHYLYGGLRLQASFGERATPAARVHLSVLLGTFVLLKAIAYWLDRYSLAVKDDRIGKADFTGLTYTDVQAVLFGKLTLSAIALICAILFFTNIVRRTWLLPGLGVGLLLLSALLVGGVYPAVVQRFQVKPAEPDREAPYIQRNIEATRTAYNIDDVDVQDYSAKTDVAAGQLRADSDTTASIRLLDPAVLDSLRQLTPPGEPDVLNEVLRIFLQEIPPRVERLRTFLAAGNIVEVQREAHSLKGSAGNIGAGSLYDICRQVDDQGRSGDLTGLSTLVDALTVEFDKVEVEIHRLLNT